MGLRDMYSAISGLEANSTWLDVIGNNISNVNTVAYKSSSVSFADSFSQTLSTGSGDESGDELGGVDPEQVGLGTRVQAITANWTEGNIQSTGVSTDVAINGTGFLISKSGDNTYLTRAGNLTFDSTGNLVDANGGLIQGYTSSIEQTTTEIESAANDPGGNQLNITNSSYVLDDTDTAAIGNININPNMTIPPKATTEINFVVNLDAAQQANSAQGGGVIQLVNAAGDATLPMGDPVVTGGLNAVDFTGLNAANELEQKANLSQNPVAGSTQAQPAVEAAITLTAAQADDANKSFAWSQQPPVTPALVQQETVYDSNGNPRTVTIQFYQVNDISGTVNGSPAVPGGPSQVAYAWYAFDTTGGAAVSTTNLVGGTGIIEGQIAGGATGYDRGTGDQYAGDLVFFNTDGSLASTGGVDLTTATQSTPDIYLPPENPNDVSPIPTIGAEVTQVSLNFGTAGLLGTGERNGLTGDAEGTYQTINGVSTYVPDSHATATQNGYDDGTLSSIAFNATGEIMGTFNNSAQSTIALGQVAMASVENEGGLTNVGNDYYQTSVNSGAETIGTAGSNGLGTISGGSLEGSNVDLTVELSNMIIAQRGFQTNARVITVESQDLQTLAQLGQ